MGWRSKCLPWAGRRTLITSVAQSLPTYTMSTFKVPNKICDKMDSLTRRFWWNPKEQQGGFITRKSWEKLCLPKSSGGLGFKKTKDINISLLAKLAWMVATKRDSLCMQILRAKYKIKHDWLRFNPPRLASPIWKAIKQAKSIIIKGACYLIGDGSSIDVWQDPWVPWYQGFIPKPRDENSTQLSMKVSHLIDHDFHCWKASIINNLFDSASAKAILSISIPSRHIPDKLIWVLDSKGLFLVKSVH